MAAAVASAPDLGRRGMRDPGFRRLLGGGAWYLVGSRAAGFGDELSDWDTVLLLPVEPVGGDVPLTGIDEVFTVDRPPLHGRPTLDFHRRWRAAQAVEVDLLGPEGRRARERAHPFAWAHDMRHAVPLGPLTKAGEDYRADVADRFREQAPTHAATSYASFRQSRNEAVAALARPDPTSQAVTAAACVAHAARFWLLTLGEPPPADKWLTASLSQHAPEAPLDDLTEAVDLRLTAEPRFDALWRIWRSVDSRALDRGTAPSQLADSPFRTFGNGDGER